MSDENEDIAISDLSAAIRGVVDAVDDMIHGGAEGGPSPSDRARLRSALENMLRTHREQMSDMFSRMLFTGGEK
jgi:ElaB/YqjD/DUF883 family membrane-anchored ribosome-binding protein